VPTLLATPSAARCSLKPVGAFPQPHPEGVTGAAFLADSLANGVGYATHLGQDPRQLLQAAQELAEDYKSHALQADGCDSSCYRCLRDHSNAAYHALLDWRLAVDMLHVGIGNPIDYRESNRLSGLLIRDFCRDFSWEATSAAGVPAAMDITFAPMAMIVTHPLERRRPPLVGRLADADRELSLRMVDGQPMQVAFASTYELVRRPGVVWSRLVSQ
jgi:hypothetical protein